MKDMCVNCGCCCRLIPVDWESKILLLERGVFAAEGVVLFGLPVDDLLPFLVGFGDVLEHGCCLLFADKEYGNQSTATEQYCNELDD